MSRFTAHLLGCDETIVTYGLDRMFGWFYQEFRGDDDAPVVDLGFPGPALSKGKLLELLEKTNAPNTHKMRIALDLDPAE